MKNRAEHAKTHALPLFGALNSQNRCFWKKISEIGIYNGRKDIGRRVIAWSNLPQPYKKEGAENENR